VASLTDYFAKRDADKPKAKYHIGDRVFGRWNKIPFVASVLREEDMNVLVQTDLPLKHNDVYHNILKLARNDVKLMKEVE
jgi:hypothetical protein